MGWGVVGSTLCALVYIGIITWQQVMAPVDMAKYLPVATTLGYVEMRPDTEDTAWNALAHLYATVPAEEALELSSLGFGSTADMLQLVDGRAGIAFFGRDFDPHAYGVVAQVKDVDAARHYLTTQKLAGESLTSEQYHGHTMVTFSQSRSVACAIIGRDVLLGSTEMVLKGMLDARDGRVASVAGSSGYGEVMSTRDRESAVWVYLDTRLWKDAVMAHVAAGLGAQMTAGVAHIVASGTTVRSGGSSLTLQTYIALDTDMQAHEVFQRALPVSTEALAAVPAESMRVVLGGNVEGIVMHALTQLRAIDPVLTSMMVNGIQTKITKLFGTAGAMAPVEELLQGDVVYAEVPHGWLMVSKGDKNAQAVGELLQLVKTVPSSMNTGMKALTLPDKTAGMLRVPSPAAVTTETAAGVTQVLVGGQLSVAYTVVGDLLLVANNHETIDLALTTLTTPDEQRMKHYIDGIGVGGNVVSYSILPTSMQLPLWLRMFGTVALGVECAPEGISVTMHLQ